MLALTFYGCFLCCAYLSLGSLHSPTPLLAKACSTQTPKDPTTLLGSVLRVQESRRGAFGSCCTCLRAVNETLRGTQVYSVASKFQALHKFEGHARCLSLCWSLTQQRCLLAGCEDWAVRKWKAEGASPVCVSRTFMATALRVKTIVSIVLGNYEPTAIVLIEL